MGWGVGETGGEGGQCRWEAAVRGGTHQRRVDQLALAGHAERVAALDEGELRPDLLRVALVLQGRAGVGGRRGCVGKWCFALSDKGGFTFEKRVVCVGPAASTSWRRGRGVCCRRRESSGGKSVRERILGGSESRNAESRARKSNAPPPYRLTSCPRTPVTRISLVPSSMSVEK